MYGRVVALCIYRESGSTVYIERVVALIYGEDGSTANMERMVVLYIWGG